MKLLQIRPIIGAHMGNQMLLCIQAALLWKIHAGASEQREMAPLGGPRKRHPCRECHQQHSTGVPERTVISEVQIQDSFGCSGPEVSSKFLLFSFESKPLIFVPFECKPLCIVDSRITLIQMVLGQRESAESRTSEPSDWHECHTEPGERAGES